jgi:predicted O-methyltransferase YrrM
MTSLEAALRAVEGVEGWLTEAQARRLFELASAVPEGGRVVEIGSYRGRSAIVLGLAAAAGVEVVAIDPHAGNDRGPQRIHGTSDEGEADHRAFVANLERAEVARRVRHVRSPSQAALGAVEGTADVVYVDGAHRYAPARDDVAGWGERVRDGGTLALHDAWSAVGVTLAQLRLLCFSRRFRYVGRTGSLAEYRREDLHGRARLVNAARQLAELGWFARNLAIKVALLAGARGLARRLGSEGWPY